MENPYKAADEINTLIDDDLNSIPDNTLDELMARLNYLRVIQSHIGIYLDETKKLADDI